MHLYQTPLYKPQIYLSDRIRLESFSIISNRRNSTVYKNNAQSHQQYNEDIINITLDGQHTYTSITVRIPSRDPTFKGGEWTYFTLCEVKIFGDM